MGMGRVPQRKLLCGPGHVDSCICTLTCVYAHMWMHATCVHAFVYQQICITEEWYKVL